MWGNRLLKEQRLREETRVAKEINLPLSNRDEEGFFFFFKVPTEKETSGISKINGSPQVAMETALHT